MHGSGTNRGAAPPGPSPGGWGDDLVSRFAQGFQAPYGLARRRDDAAEHVADPRGVGRVPRTAGGIRASGPEIFHPRPASEVPEEERRAQLPMDQFPVTGQGVFGGKEGHSTRSPVLLPDGSTMHVGVGLAGNVSAGPEPRATLEAFDADGGEQRTVATGTRNPTGLGFRPGTDELWAIVEERDGPGDRLVPDHFTRVEEETSSAGPTPPPARTRTRSSPRSPPRG